MDCCRSEDNLALPIVNTDARESSAVLYQSLMPSAFVIYLFHADFYLTEVASKYCKPDFRSYFPIPSSSTDTISDVLLQISSTVRAREHLISVVLPSLKLFPIHNSLCQLPPTGTDVAFRTSLCKFL